MNRVNKRIIIHLGLPKAASTFLQQRVFNNFHDTALIGPEFIRVNRPLSQLLLRDTRPFRPAEVYDVINKLPGSTVIISHESFSGIENFNYVNYNLIIKRLAHCFPEASYIYFIRNQLDWLTSFYKQYITSAMGVYSPEDYFMFNLPELSYATYQKLKKENRLSIEHDALPPGKEPRFPVSVIDICNNIQFYTKAVNDLHIFTYEEFKTSPKATIEKLSEIIDKSVKQPVKYEVLNKNIGSSIAIRVLRHYNKLYYLHMGWHAKGKWLFNKLTWGKPYTLPGHLQAQIKTCFRPGNQKLAGEFPEIGLERYKKAYFLTDKD